MKLIITKLHEFVSLLNKNTLFTITANQDVEGIIQPQVDGVSSLDTLLLTFCKNVEKQLEVPVVVY